MGTMRAGRLTFRVHAIKRMFQRKISAEDVRAVLLHGKVLETYPLDKPFPSKLVLGWRKSRPIHVVTADDIENDETIIITVYEPNPKLWGHDFKRRKK